MMMMMMEARWRCTMDRLGYLLSLIQDGELARSGCKRVLLLFDLQFLLVEDQVDSATDLFVRIGSIEDELLVDLCDLMRAAIESMLVLDGLDEVRDEVSEGGVEESERAMVVVLDELDELVGDGQVL